MKNSQFKRIISSTILFEYEYISFRNLYFKSGFKDIVSGIAMDSSSHDRNSFYVWYFSIPIYIPTSFFYFNLGDRLWNSNPGHSGQVWNSLSNSLIQDLNIALADQAVVYIEAASSPRGLIDALILRGWETGKTAIEATAYSLVRLGDFIAAKQRLIEFISELRPREITHDIPKLERAELLINLINREPEAAQIQLAQWADFTLSSLELRSCWGGDSSEQIGRTC